MRTWRVGSFSMGGALVFLGVFLLLQQFFGWDPALVLMSWWPVLFIVLGVEILLYLFMARTENSRVKYDFISIIFIAFIGTTGIGMAVLHSIGLFDFAQKVVSAEVREMDLPKYEESNLTGIKRLQVETGPFDLSIETTDQKEISIFGTYEGDGFANETRIKEVSDYAMVEKKGDTIYIKMKEIPYNHFYRSMDTGEATLLIPQNIALELKGNWQPIKAAPRNLLSDWNIEGAETVHVNVEKTSNLTVAVDNVDYVDDQDWDEIKKTDADSVESALRKYGKGEHRLTIKGANTVHVNEK
ncbi:hypothetical protein MUB24_08685 [Lederbergia sp. NSJ-179]|uniref:LiaI-LiaF-like domain-containing protein n=1 Tax=Lederbergia sp. NSJ-179 TaxID=2931402 RepID=UPI001FCFA1E2|nr:DUF5668 domain-containing protein [Lederbergia sp. NSJ-179]MCJ7840976.1 hypothetical protein [Lederbergia sp. NSJ-179]